MAKYHLEFCPFCGEIRAPRLKFHGVGVKKFFIVKCEPALGGCGASVTGATRNLAIEKWNRREHGKLNENKSIDVGRGGV